MANLIRMFLCFLCYSAAGWLCESIYCSIPERRWINRGFLFGPVCPVYGVGALIAAALLAPIAWSIPLLFLCGAVLMSVVEYLTGWLLETLFHAKWWDYSDQKWNLQGRVCLHNSILFGLMCTALVRWIHPLIAGWMENIPQGWLLPVGGALFAVFAADAVFSVRGALQLRGKLEAMQEILDEIRERTESALAGQRQAVRLAVDSFGQRTQAGREEALERLRERQARLEESVRGAQRRLLAAFPTMRTRRGREALARLRGAVEARRKRAKHEENTPFGHR